MNFLTIKQLSEKYGFYTDSAIRNLIRLSTKNGFSFCIRRIGAKILINEEDFLNWIENHKGKL